MRASRPGQKLQEVYTSKLHNELVRASRKLPTPGKPPLGPEVNPIVVKAFSSSITKERFEAVNITGPALDIDNNDDTDPAFGFINVLVDAEPTDENFGILQGPLTDVTTPKLVLVGLTWAKFELLNTNDTHVQLVSNTLKSSTSGPARIIRKPEGTAPVTGLGLILISGTGNASAKMYVLLEDMTAGHGSSARAQTYDWEQNELGKIDLYNWGKPSVAGGGFLDGVKAGYYGLAIQIEGRWAHAAGPCIDDFLCSSSGTLSGTPTDGEVNTAYAYAMTASGLNTDIGASGLPPGLSINASTGNITGTPTTEGTYEVTFTATAENTDPLEDDCTITIIRTITINPEP